MSYITLFQLNNLILNTLDQHLEPHYWVVAEIGEMREAQKGHCYLDLVEKEGPHLTAKMKAVIWAYDYRNLKGFFQTVTGKRLQPGMKILAKVGVQFHEVFGLNLQIRDLDPNFTLGERARHRQQVIDRLSQEELLHSNKQLVLPLVPQRVAVISAETAAGYGDFMDQLINNEWGYRFEVSLFKSIMQGTEAVPSLASALEKVYQQDSLYDLLVIIRGGGSQVDLDCFDSYQVAAAVAKSPLPVITGIGHERDQTVVDLVAHTSLKTPTAVAEFLLSGMKTVDLELNDLGQRLRLSVVSQLQGHQSKLQRLSVNLGHFTKALLQRQHHQHAIYAQRLSSAARRVLQENRFMLQQTENFLAQYPQKLLQQERRLLSSLEGKIKLADPHNILKRGFSITYKNGMVVKKGEEVKPGDELVTKTQTTDIRSKVHE